MLKKGQSMGSGNNESMRWHVRAFWTDRVCTQDLFQVLDEFSGVPDLQADLLPGLQEYRIGHKGRFTLLQG
jgi:hypothetical protein